MEDLSKLTLHKLKELAKERGVKIPAKSKKAEIVELLSGSSEESGSIEKKEKATSSCPSDPWVFIWGQEEDKVVKNYRSREAAVKGATDYARKKITEYHGDIEGEFWDEKAFQKYLKSHKGIISLRCADDAPDFWDEIFFLKIRPLKFED